MLTRACPDFARASSRSATDFSGRRACGCDKSGRTRRSNQSRRTRRRDESGRTGSNGECGAWSISRGNGSGQRCGKPRSRGPGGACRG